MQEHRNSLSAGYRLHWYVIKKILGQGGFGITYLAEDTNLNQEVAIKEYLPIELAVREQDASIHPVSGEYGEQFSWGLDSFMSEAQTLAQFKHPNIVRVLTVFPENNTAYMVMEYEQGQGMDALLKARKTLNESELNAISQPILDGLEQVHSAGFIHRDIKPPNIFIRADGTPVLLDFGSARQSLGEKTRTLTSMVSPGFAPFEQYVSKSDKQGPWTDIYGLAATLYRSAVGRSPAEAMDRSEALLHTERDSFVSACEIAPEGYSQTFLAAIDHGLAFKPGERPQTIGQWRAEFSGSNVSTQFEEAETIPILPSSIIPAAEATEQTTAKNTIKTEQQSGIKDETPIADKSRSWYRKPLKVIALVSAVLLLLVILDDADNEGNESTMTEIEGVSGLPAVTGDEADELPGSGAEEGAEHHVARSQQAHPLKQLTASKHTDIVNANDRHKLKWIKKQLARNPDTVKVRRELRKLGSKYEGLVKKALHDKNYVLARSYIEAMLELTPDNRKLLDSLHAIRAKQAAD